MSIPFKLQSSAGRFYASQQLAYDYTHTHILYFIFIIAENKLYIAMGLVPYLGEKTKEKASNPYSFKSGKTELLFVAWY